LLSTRLRIVDLARVVREVPGGESAPTSQTGLA